MKKRGWPDVVPGLGVFAPRAMRDLEDGVKRPKGQNPLLHLIAVNLFGGSVLGLGLAAVLLVFDLADLRTLILSSDNALMAVIMMFVCSASTFATAAIAGAIMLLAAKDEDGDIRRPGAPQYAALPTRNSLSPRSR